MQRKSNGVDSQKIALQWLGLGIKPVPLQPKQKKPRGHSWQKLRVTEKTIPEHFNNGDNVGGLWGRPSGWIVDVDLDDEDAADLAEYILPPTMIFGRESRPETHFLYVCKGAKTHKWMDSNKKAIVELRSTGAQTVLPPSIHPDDERYIVDDWNDDQFTPLPRIRLVRYLDEIAAGALFMRNYPEEAGSRHDYVHALTGALLWSKWKPEDVRRVAKAIVYACQDKDDDPKQRLRTIENTIEHHKQGHRVAGWKTLRDWIKQKDLQLMRQWLDNKDFIEPTPEDLEELPTFGGGRMPKFDKKLLEVPGLVGDLVKWSAKQTYLDQPPFDLATALMCTALATCNHYEVDNWETPLQPYFMLLAPTAAGKGASLDRVYEFAQHVGLGDHVYQGFQSYHALMDELADAPNMVCWLWDEAARHLRTAKSIGSQDFQILSHLISLYGRATKHVPGSPGRKNPIPPLDNPFLTLFATAQPAQLVEAISAADMATGFVNRFILFDSGDEVPRRNQQRTHIFPAAILKLAKLLKSHEPKRGRTIIRFSGVESFAMFDDFAEQARKRIQAGEVNDIWGRANQNALLVSGIVAVGVNPKRPRITPEIASWALRLITWSIESWMLRIEDLSTGGFREVHSKKIEGIIRNPKALVNKRTRASQKALLKKGLVPKSILTAKCRSLNSREIEDIVEQLLQIGLIGSSEQDDGTLVYWAKR